MASLRVNMLAAYLVQLPVYLAWLAGLVLCLLTWRKHPRVSLLALMAFLLLFLDSFVGTYLDLRLPIFLARRSMTASGIDIVLTVKSLVQATIHALAWALVLGAIFGWRSDRHQ